MVESEYSPLPVNWTYYGCNEEDEARFAEYWRTHSHRLMPKTQELADAVSQLNIVVEHETDEDIWRIRGALFIPGGTLVAEVSAGGPEETMDALLEALAAEVNNAQQQPTSVGRHRPGVAGLESILTRLYEANRSDAFMSLLLPLVASVGPYIRRELQVREIHGSLSGADTSSTDLIDDVLLAAWEQFPNRNKQRALDLWLVELADEALTQLEQRPHEVSLEERIPAPSPNNANSRQDEWVEQVSYFDRIELARLLETKHSIDDWDDSQLENTQRHLAELLGALPRDGRQALILSAALGYSTDEIADFQSRQRDQVEAEIDSAVSQLRSDSRFEQLRDLEEQYSRQDVRRHRKRHSAQR